jgi:hypothetical protein
MRILTLLAASVLTLSGCIYPLPSSDEKDKPEPVPKVAPEVIPENVIDRDAPPMELQLLVSPLAQIITDEKDAAKAAKFFRDFADVLSRDNLILKTTEDVREGYIRAETLMLQNTEMVGKYPGFGAAKDKILVEAVGLERVTLSPEKRAKAVAVFNAMAWVLGG